MNIFLYVGKFLSILIVTFLGVSLLLSCVSVPEGEEIPGTNFKVIELKGMPCIYGHMGHGKMLTCDWTKFDPRK